MSESSIRSERLLFESLQHRSSKVTVAVTLHNYAAVVTEALESVYEQDLQDFDLVIVDDASHDSGAERVVEWIGERASRFGHTLVLQHTNNLGLAASRNRGFVAAATPYVFVLDADNQLYPKCLSKCVAALEWSGADAAYTLLEVFGERRGIMGTDEWDPSALRQGNYIDAMALIRLEAWRKVGGYRPMAVSGWEDYDLWLKFVEHGLELFRVPEILCRYRTGHASMLVRLRENPSMTAALHEDIRLHHPDVRLPFNRP